MIYPSNKSKILTTVLLVLPFVLTFSETKPTNIFLTDEKEYILEDSNIEDDQSQIEFDYDGFILHDSPYSQYDPGSNKSLNMNYRVVPCYRSSTNFLYSFDEQNIHFLNYDILSSLIYFYKLVNIEQILPPQYIGTLIKGFFFLNDSVCVFELGYSDSELRIVISMEYTLSTDFLEIVFLPKTTLKVTKNYFKESFYCEVEFVFVNSCFVRHCTNTMSENNFIYFPKISRDPIMFSSFSVIDQIQLITKDNELCVYYIKNGHLRKFQITGSKNKKDTLIAIDVFSFYAIDFAEVYFITTDFRVLHKAISLNVKYHISKNCESIHWFNFDNLFFICFENNLEKNATYFNFYLADFYFFKQIKITSLEYVNMVALPQLKHLAFFYGLFEPEKTILGIVQIFKVFSKLKMSSLKFSMNVCPYYVFDCLKYNFVLQNSKTINFYKMNVSEKFDYSKYFGYLITSQNFNHFDWKFIKEENYFFVDDFVSGFISDIKISSNKTKYLNSHLLMTPRYDVRINSQMIFEVFKEPDMKVHLNGMLSNDENIISFIIYYSKHGKIFIFYIYL
jgi:hypothetical protein